MTQPFNFYGAAATQGNADEYDEDDLVGYSSARSYMATQPFEEEKQAAPEAPPTVQNSSFYGGATQPFANELGDLFDNVEGPASPEEPHEKDSNEVQPTAQLYQTQMFDSKNTASSSTDQISPESPSHNESTGYPQTQMFGGESQDDTESPASPKGDETDQPSIENHYQTQLFATGPSESQNLSDLDNFQHQHAAATQPFEVADESADVSELLGDTADLDEGESSLQAKYAKGIHSSGYLQQLLSTTVSYLFR